MSLKWGGRWVLFWESPLVVFGPLPAQWLRLDPVPPKTPQCWWSDTHLLSSSMPLALWALSQALPSILLPLFVSFPCFLCHLQSGVHFDEVRNIDTFIQLPHMSDSWQDQFCYQAQSLLEMLTFQKYSRSPGASLGAWSNRLQFIPPLVVPDLLIAAVRN